MSLVLESNTAGNRIERPPGFIHSMSCIAFHDSPAHFRRFQAAKDGGVVKESDQGQADSCGTSSIGKNNDSSDGEIDCWNGDGDWDCDGDAEVQSSYKRPFANLDALEEVLPIKRGISKFYAGKSKSFTCLEDAASCSSIKDIGKPENAYTRKRKNLLAYHNFWDKNSNNQSGSSNGGILKRLANSSRNTLAPGMSVSGSDNSNNNEVSNLDSSPPALSLPPLPPQSRKLPCNELSLSLPRRNFCSGRSFSLSDLQCAAAVVPSLAFSNQHKPDKLR